MTRPGPPGQRTPLPAINANQVPSLSIVEHALSDEDTSYRERANGIDTKAGVILSAAGVIVTLVGIHSSVAGLVGQFIAIAAGAAAVWTLKPRVDKAIGIRQLRDRYLQENELSTRMILLNTRLDIQEKNEKYLFRKARWLKISSSLLLCSATAIAIGGSLNVISH
ncbi:hypothetical protein SAMN05892883_2197 [Jatrophihabitans sp. GAS493]|uniref:hypothetical protein n=1 Tax=Jatrophihabitans sp. GAS493 TaxID=1907575 RepID=UPI000BB8A1D4|nr:hypothetical protein [Jatrophihabitans sp. GAS493]SOD72878.1 hypothetical protein SAMN05892883_2197 [Jatrophihabitans sp. GAS493]